MSSVLQVGHNELSMHKAVNCQKIFSGQFSFSFFFFVIQTGIGVVEGVGQWRKLPVVSQKLVGRGSPFGLL